ncbi:MAG: hypothetical protein KBT30_01920 [Clostridiales bacterium]|nr:hypothetical protein [Candidatus Apopatousia equi]
MKEKIVDSTIKKCKNCGGNLMFSPHFQCLYCENCNSQFEIEKDTNIEKHEYSDNIKKDDNVVNSKKIYKCQNCGANIELDGLQQSRVCPYCESPYVVENKELVGLKPDMVVPFAFDKEKASENFVKNIKHKWFLPNKFKKAPPIDRIYGIYFPAFGFDEDTVSTYDGRLEHDHTTTINGHATTTTTYQHIKGTIALNHENIFVETSNHLTQNQFEGIKPFNTENFYKYNDDFIRGYSVEYYVDELNVCKDRAEVLIDNNIRANILRKYSYDRVSYLNVSTTRSNLKYDYAILPTYKFTYHYGKKDYTTFMNGQTGRVDNNLPKSKVKITFTVLTIILIIACIIGLSIFLG